MSDCGLLEALRVAELITKGTRSIVLRSEDGTGVFAASRPRVCMRLSGGRVHLTVRVRVLTPHSRVTRVDYRSGDHGLLLSVPYPRADVLPGDVLVQSVPVS